MKTAGQIIAGALRTLGALGSGEAPTEEELADGLEALNGLIGYWSDDNLLIPSRTRETLAVPSQAHQYTIGDGGELDTAWPMQVDVVEIHVGGSVYPLRPMTPMQYSDRVTNFLPGQPTRYHFEPSWPLAVLTLDRAAEVGTSLLLVGLKPLAPLDDAETEIDLPGAYPMALRFNLAVALAAEYGSNANLALIREQAETTKRAIQTRIATSRVPRLKVDPGLLHPCAHRYDINTDA